MTSPHLFWLLSGVGGILVLATLVGQALRTRVAPDGSNPVIENLNARIAAWWGMVALLSIAFLAGRAGVVILFALLSFAALREFLSLTAKSTADHWSLAAAFFLILPLQYWLICGSTKAFLVRIAETQWALMICIYCISHVPALLSLQIPGFEGRNVMLIAWLIFVVQLSDVLQYVWGKLIGRHKIAPNLSPSKTWEGFVGGTLSATLIGTALWWMTPFSLTEAAGMCLAVTLMGFFGGLVMSAIKRDKGVKDWGHLIAGHGGFIDRLDSVIFAAPIFFHLTRYWYSTV